MAHPPVPSDSKFQVVVISGPSGSGKTTLVNRLIEESPVSLMKCISATTRPRRPAEVDGEDYYFLSPVVFEKRRLAGDFLEVAEVHKSGFWYGTLWDELQRARKQNSWALLEVDVQGALRIMDFYPEAVSIFLKTPSPAEFERRLRARGTESEQVIQRRLQTAAQELMLADRYRYQVVNDELNQAVAEICSLLAAREAEINV